MSFRSVSTVGIRLGGFLLWDCFYSSHGLGRLFQPEEREGAVERKGNSFARRGLVGVLVGREFFQSLSAGDVDWPIVGQDAVSSEFKLWEHALAPEEVCCLFAQFCGGDPSDWSSMPAKLLRILAFVSIHCRRPGQM